MRVLAGCRSLHEGSPLMPDVIRDYIAEMKLHLEYLTRQPELPLEEKLGFLRETRHTFGRSALVLSGGGALGVFHLVRFPLTTDRQVTKDVYVRNQLS